MDPCRRIVVLGAAWLAVGAARADALPDPDRGLCAIWFRPAQNVFAIPFVRGGQVMLLWSDVETDEGKYDWTKLDAALADYHRQGRKATVQINGNRHPAYLFRQIAVLKEDVSEQVKDPQGALMYWDPLYVAAYERLLAAYGEHLRQSPYRAAVLGVRLNFNALGTEHTHLRQPQRDPARWTPAPNGRRHVEAWTPEVAACYRRTVIDAFIRAFAPDVRIFVRNNVLAGLPADLLACFEKGEWALFHTSSECEPRSDGVARQHEAFLRYCRTGQTVAYAESWADAEGHHGQKRDEHVQSPEQWNYWHLLLELHSAGFPIAVYGNDLAHADQPGFRAAFEFTARYAGHHASPATAPGAWVALREGNHLKGDYTFLMRQLRRKETGTPTANVGPHERRFGAWARSLAAGQKLLLQLDRTFAESLKGRACRVRVVYLDEGTAPLTLHWDAGGREATQPIPRRGTGRWQEATVDVPAAAFAGGLSGADLTISSAEGCVLHMVEVLRE